MYTCFQRLRRTAESLDIQMWWHITLTVGVLQNRAGAVTGPVALLVDDTERRLPSGKVYDWRFESEYVYMKHCVMYVAKDVG